MIQHLNKHLETKMFLVGQNITAADIVVHLYIVNEFKKLTDTQKKEVPHAFRWVDHVQHLPGMLELVEQNGIFVSFPSEKEEKLSKAQLKKLAKEQWQKDKKDVKFAEKDSEKPEEEKKQETQQKAPKQEKP